MFKKSRPFVLLLSVVLLAGCSSSDSPVEPGDGPGDSPYSNMAFDRFGLAVVPGATADVSVTPRNGDLEPFTVTSGDNAIATATGTFNEGAGPNGSDTGTLSIQAGSKYGSTMVTLTTESGDAREFPVTVYDPMVLETEELQIRFTSEFAGRFNDSGSGADEDGDFYMPVPPEGYHALGAVGFRGYQNPADLNSAAIVIKDKGTNPNNPPLKAPDDYELIWHNGVNILGGFWTPDGNVTGSFWRPIPPEGYVALGAVVHNWEAGTTSPAVQKPDSLAVVCVREDLTATGAIGGFVWWDKGNGLSDRFFAASQLLAPSAPNIDEFGPEVMYIAPNTFVSGPSHGPFNTDNAMANVLKVEPQLLVDVDYFSTLLKPELSSTATVGAGTKSQPLRKWSMLVPFTAFADAGETVRWKAENSPFYLMERSSFWTVECSSELGGTCSISYEAGTEQTSGYTEWETEGVEVSKSAGFNVKGVGGSVESTVTRTMGFAQSTGNAVFESKTVTLESDPAPADGIAVTWKATNRFDIYRHRGQNIENVVDSWVWFQNNYIVTKYSPSGN